MKSFQDIGKRDFSNMGEECPVKLKTTEGLMKEEQHGKEIKCQDQKDQKTGK